MEYKSTSYILSWSSLSLRVWWDRASKRKYENSSPSSSWLLPFPHLLPQKSGFYRTPPLCFSGELRFPSTSSSMATVFHFCRLYLWYFSSDFLLELGFRWWSSELLRFSLELVVVCLIISIAVVFLFCKWCFQCVIELEILGFLGFYLCCFRKLGTASLNFEAIVFMNFWKFDDLSFV